MVWVCRSPNIESPHNHEHTSWQLSAAAHGCPSFNIELVADKERSLCVDNMRAITALRALVRLVPVCILLGLCCSGMMGIRHSPGATESDFYICFDLNLVYRNTDPEDKRHVRVCVFDQQ